MGFLSNGDYWMGYAGVVLHIMSKLDKGQSIFKWIKANTNDLVTSLICYNVLIYLWYSNGIDFFGMVKAQLNALSVVIGYAGNSLMSNLLTAYEKRFSQAATKE